MAAIIAQSAASRVVVKPAVSIRRSCKVQAAAFRANAGLSKKVSFAGSKRTAVVVRAEAADDLNEKLSEVTETLKEKWAETDDKPAVITLGVYALIGLVAANGVLKAVDSLPLIPQMLELIGIGFSAFYVYQNLLFKPDRAALKDQISKNLDKIL